MHQLSYQITPLGKLFSFLVAGEGFEPPTFRLWLWRATELLYPASLLSLDYHSIGAYTSFLWSFLKVFLNSFWIDIIGVSQPYCRIGWHLWCQVCSTVITGWLEPPSKSFTETDGNLSPAVDGDWADFLSCGDSAFGNVEVTVLTKFQCFTKTKSHGLSFFLKFIVSGFKLYQVIGCLQ